jgi:hypothetical protein
VSAAARSTRPSRGRLGGGELVTVTAALADDVEPIRVAGAGHGRVDPFAVGLVSREYERVAAREALSYVGRERVAVLERGAAVVGRLREEVSVELSEPAPEADAERARRGIDALDDPAIAVANVVAAVVALHEHAIGRWRTPDPRRSLHRS